MLKLMAVPGPPSRVMNTYDRHRRFLLRRQRTRILKRRALLLTVGVALALSAWSVVSHIGPAAVAPPPPSRVGGRMLRTLLTQAANVANEVHAVILPQAAVEMKKDALALFVTPVPDSGTAGSPQTSAASADSISQPADPPVTGRTFDVLLIGVDSRLGRERGRADALQLITIELDRGEVEIVGIPRGTPSQLGYDTARSNIIANVLAARGRDELLRRVARLTGRDSLRYWVEVGFSDALGILELLGFEQPARELQHLRRRKGYRYGDHTRSYTQARIVRTALLRLLPMLGEATGSVLLSQGLRFMRTNLRTEECHGLAILMNDAGIAEHPERVRVRVRSPYDARLQRDAEATIPGADTGDREDSRAEHRIVAALTGARGKKSEIVVRRLWTMFQQHAWLQVPEHTRRRELRDTLAARLTAAWTALERPSECGFIERTLEADDALFQLYQPRTDAGRVSLSAHP